MVNQQLIYKTQGYWKELILLSWTAYNDSITLYWNTIISWSLWFPPPKFLVQKFRVHSWRGRGLSSHLWPLAGTLLLHLALWQQSWSSFSGTHPIPGSLWHILAPSGSFPILTLLAVVLRLSLALIRSLALSGTFLALWQRLSLVADSLSRLSLAVLQKPQEKVFIKKNLRKSLWGPFWLSLAPSSTLWHFLALSGSWHSLAVRQKPQEKV